MDINSMSKNLFSLDKLDEGSIWVFNKSNRCFFVKLEWFIGDNYVFFAHSFKSFVYVSNFKA